MVGVNNLSVNSLFKGTVIGLLWLAAVSACLAKEESRREPMWVSLVSLIATPEKYDGKYVRVLGVGYLDSKYSIHAIYLTREDKLKANDANAIFLYFSSRGTMTDRLNNRFVVAQGVFRSNEKGHLHVFSGSLIDVDRLETVVGNVN